MLPQIARNTVAHFRGQLRRAHHHALRSCDVREHSGEKERTPVQAGQQSKAEQVYSYLTGSRFKQRIEAVVERFKDMRDDIDKERKFMVKAWAKREAQVCAMIESTVGMVGDLHGIVGQAMPDISAIDEPTMLEGKAA
jgi:hypothetical protein